jgi:hypothetical protein
MLSRNRPARMYWFRGDSAEPLLDDRDCPRRSGRRSGRDLCRFDCDGAGKRTRNGLPWLRVSWTLEEAVRGKLAGEERRAELYRLSDETRR